MSRVRLLLFIAATAVVAACSTAPTSPTSQRHIPKVLHDVDSTTDSTGSHGGFSNPNG